MSAVTPDNLSEVMEFDHVIRVDADGTVTDEMYREHPVWAPNLDAEAESVDDPAWTLEKGWTGQYSYNGSMMHASEYVGGRLAEHILATPGYWVTLYDPEHDDEWAIAFKPLDD